nr:uncharacterized protein LOC115257164 [Aedes albopictus]XP_029724642.1 uncharacterized protein LOC115264755 [Aedes albopictus]
MIILKIIEGLNAAVNNDEGRKKEPGPPGLPSKEVCRRMLEENSKFRLNVLLPVLDKGLVPDDKDLRFLNRVACKPFETRIERGGKYPSADEQERLAKDLVELFPQLQYNSTRPEGAPNEWMFFWRKNGTEKGKHSGLIYHRVRNVIKELPAEMHLYRRTTAPRQVHVPTELLQKAEALRIVIATKHEKNRIATEMDECFPLLKLMLAENKSPTEIIRMFPHLVAYNGYIIHNSFKKLFPAAEVSPDYKGVLSKCLLYSRDKFERIEDEYIKGFLRMLYQLPVRGLKRKIDGTPAVSEERMATPLIRWVKPMTNNDDDLADHVRSFLQVEPHIVCMAQPLQMGQLFVVMNNQIIVKVQNSISAIDIFFKSFKVFGLTIPSELAMMIDFLECALYHTVGHSSRKSVNLMAIAFKEVAHAEDAVFNE